MRTNRPKMGDTNTKQKGDVQHDSKIDIAVTNDINLLEDTKPDIHGTDYRKNVIWYEIRNRNQGENDNLTIVYDTLTIDMANIESNEIKNYMDPKK